MQLDRSVTKTSNKDKTDTWYMQRVHTIIVHVAVYLCLLALNVDPVVARFIIRDYLLNLYTWRLRDRKKFTLPLTWYSTVQKKWNRNSPKVGKRRKKGRGREEDLLKTCKHWRKLFQTSMMAPFIPDTFFTSDWKWESSVRSSVDYLTVSIR